MFMRPIKQAAIILLFVFSFPHSVPAQTKPFPASPGYRSLAQKIVIDGKGDDWIGIPSVTDPRDHNPINDSRDIKRVAIAYREADLLILIETWAKPLKDNDGVYWANVDLLGYGEDDIQIGLSPTAPDQFWVFEEGASPKAFGDNTVLQIVVDEVMEVRIPFDALRAVLTPAQRALFQPGYLRPWAAVTVFSPSSNPTDISAPCSAYQLLENPADYETRPVSGLTVPELAVFDQTMISFMDETDIPSGTLQVSRNGQPLFQRGYGWADYYRHYPVGPGAIMQLGSISKVIAATAIKQLERDGKLSLDAKVYDLLGLPSPTGTVADPRMKTITVRQLMDHTSGFPEPLPSFREMALKLGLNRPTQPADLWRYALAYTKLDSDPGTAYKYSIGYEVLGEVVQHVSGLPYMDYLNATILKGLNASTIKIGPSRVASKDPREIWYGVSGWDPDQFDITNMTPVRPENGGFYMEGHFATGSMVSNAADLSRFLRRWWLSGEPRDSADYYYAFYGSLYGFGMALQLPGNIDVVVLCNKRPVPWPDGTNALHLRMERAAQSIAKWPTAHPDGRDLDHDGHPDLLQYAMGGNLDRPATGLLAKNLTVTASAGNQPPSLTVVRDPSHNDLTYEVQTSSDLLNWTAIATSELGLPFVGTATVTGDGSDPSPKTLEIRDALTPGSTARFFRLEVRR